MFKFAVHYVFEHKLNNVDDVNTIFWKFQFLGVIMSCSGRVGSGQGNVVDPCVWHKQAEHAACNRRTTRQAERLTLG